MTASRLFLGISYLNIERPREALALLEAAHREQPTLESALQLGQAYMAHFLYEKAIRCFEEALPRAGDQSAGVLYFIGKSYLALAERLVNDQTDTYPNSKDTHFAAAQLFESQQLYEVAAIKYLEAAELDPLNASIFFPLARMLAILGLMSRRAWRWNGIGTYCRGPRARPLTRACSLANRWRK